MDARCLRRFARTTRCVLQIFNHIGLQIINFLTALSAFPIADSTTNDMLVLDAINPSDFALQTKQIELIDEAISATFQYLFEVHYHKAVGSLVSLNSCLQA